MYNTCPWYRPKTPYYATEVAQYCIYYCVKQGKQINNLQLQKILYYIQGKFLAEKDTPCFRDEITAWRYGPVVQDIYYIYKYKATKPLEFNFMQSEFNFITKEDKLLIQQVCNEKSRLDAFELARATMSEPPFKKTKHGEIISVEDINEYFKSLEE